jgi:diguanylate cyclase (GGDEF)-like protein
LVTTPLTPDDDDPEPVVPVSAADMATLRSLEALNHTAVMITLHDRRGRALYRNPAAGTAVVDPRTTVRARFAEPRQFRHLLDAVRRDGHGRLTAAMRTPHGLRWHDISAQRCQDPATGTLGCLFSEIDVTELKQVEARARYLALHDTLTGLHNRNHVTHGLPRRLAEWQAAGREAVLILIDLDRFKHINDSLGHGIGDRLLIEMARRLRALASPDDALVRLGGDEFLLVSSGADLGGRAERLGTAVREAIARPVPIGRLQVQVTASLGWCRFPHDGTDIDTLLRHVDIALYRAKGSGRNAIARFTPDMKEAARTRMALEHDLRRALGRQQFVLHYQPRVHLASGRLRGAEALVRWQHPNLGLVMPDVFIGVCEDTGLIRRLGAEVLAQAARQQVTWARRGWPLRISVNLSPRQIDDPELLATVDAIVRDTGCDPRWLELEITESVLVGRDDLSTGVLHALADRSFRLAIDDFGTGYSNLAYLPRYPIQSLKIDRTFLGGETSVHPLVRLILTMCRMLGIDTVAEGVETASQLAWLRENDCDEYQGNLFSPALPADAFEQLVARVGLALDLGQPASTAAMASAVASTLPELSPATHIRPERTR